MNKTKKIATAVVSLVLASTMCLSIAGCSSSSRGQKELTQSQDTLEVSVDENGDLSYKSGTSLVMNVGYNTANDMSISYTSKNLSGTVKLPDGKSYSTNSLKPAWAGLQDVLDVTFTDSYTNKSGTAQITDNITQDTLKTYNIVTATSATIVTNATSDSDLFLDLSLYLDYMPNYKKFLQDNPIVYMSLTSDTDTGAMYYTPYFDGNDDIEKYEIAKKNWISTILDSASQPSDTITFKAQADAKATAVTGGSSTYGINGTASAVESYMGTTGSWWIESTDPSDETKTVTVTVSYDNVIKALKDSSSDLYKAVADALTGTSESVQTTSGNIVDIQNQVIDATSGAVTGAQLTAILQAYVDVAYLNASGSSYYTTRSDVFNGSDATWDVDLLVALMRCVVTYGNTNLGTKSAIADIYGLTGRQNTSQRMSDMYSLAGELYGVRGFTSRYKNTYIDSNGVLQEARAQTESYEALDKMHAMVEEGLYNVSGNMVANMTSYYTGSAKSEALMIYDYVQTQTANGGYDVMGIKDVSDVSVDYPNAEIEDDYDFEPIVTPVSRWNDGDTSTEENVDGIAYSYDNDGNKYMRFTESWRSVKDSGVCIPRESVENDPEKLAAVLAFIDYFYSNDGQMLMTFGTQSTNGNTASSATASSVTSTDNGWWYGTEVTNVDIDTVATKVGGQYYIDDEYAAKYFCYNNTLYTGTYYNGKMYPTMTNANLAFYYGNSVNNVSQSNFGVGGILSYTNYARRIIGSALPIGNKLQAFEYQCTSDQGINGANIVAAGLTNGTISHVYQTVGDDNGKGFWYTIVPTTLPYTTTQSTWINTYVAESLDNSVFAVASDVSTNMFIQIMAYGLGNSNAYLTSIAAKQSVPATAEACVSLLTTTYALGTYVGYMQSAWDNILDYYDNYIVYLLEEADEA